MASLFLSPLLPLALVLIVAPASAQSQATPDPQLPKGCTAISTASEADEALYAEDWGKATRLYRDKLKENPASLEAQAGLIRVALGQDRVSDAETTALAMVKEAPRSVVAQTTLGEVYIWRGEIELAPAQLTKALALDPCYARAHYAEGRLATLMGYHAMAARQLAIAHALTPQDSQTAVAWMFTLPPDQRFPLLKQFLNNVKYLNEDDREDLKSQVTEGELRMNSECTVTAPQGGTHVPLYVAPVLSKDPGRPTVDLTINGSKHRAFFDTSTNGVDLPWKTGKRLGLTPLAHVSYALLYTGGRLNYYLAKVDSLRIGDVEYRNCIVSIRDESAEDAGYQLESINLTGADMGIGATFLSDFMIRVDAPAKTLALTPLPPAQGPEVDATGLPMWSNAGHGTPQTVRSINGGSWGQYNRTVSPEMKDWTPLFRYRNETWVATKIGAGPSLLFELELSNPWPRIATTASTSYTKLENTGSGTPPFKGYFMSFGGMYIPVSSWTAERWDEYSKHLKLETSGTIGQDALRQVSFTLDLRDNLVKFERAKQ